MEKANLLHNSLNLFDFANPILNERGWPQRNARFSLNLTTSKFMELKLQPFCKVVPKKIFYKIHYNPTKFLCIIWPCAKNNDERSASGQIIIFLLEHRRICTDFGPIINEDKGMFFWDTLYVMDVDILCLGSEVFATRLMICNKMLNHCQILLTMQYGGLHVIVA